MSKRDTLKTAKRCIQAEEQSLDGYQDRSVKKPKKKERQKGRKVIRDELFDECTCDTPTGSENRKCSYCKGR